MPLKPSQRFSRWLDDKLLVLPPGSRLPTGKELARQWGLSESTVRAILRTYAAREKLWLIRGKGTFIPSRRPLHPDIAVPPRSSMQTVADVIVTSIRNGSLRIGESLPSIKYMSLQFRVAPSTVIKAYRRLQEQRYVVKVGKTFCVGDFDSVIHSRTPRSIYFFNYNSFDFRTIFKNTWLAPAYRKMERTLLSYGFSIHYGSTQELDRLLPAWTRNEKKWPDGLFFYKLFAARMARLASAFKRIDHHALTHGMPVLIDWQRGDFTEIPRHMHVLSRGNIYTTRARTVADYIVRRGYREAVLLFDETKRDFGWLLSIIRIHPEIRVHDPSFVFRIAVKPGKYSPDVAAFYRRFYNSRSISSIKNILGKYHPVPLASIEHTTRLVDDFSSIVETGQAKTILLCMEDQTAVDMLAACRRREIAVPRETGILSFENDPRFYHLGISCCVPDWERIGYLLAHTMIGDFPIERTSKGFIRVKADILERDTT